jgi:hypothetical protein
MQAQLLRRIPIFVRLQFFLPKIQLGFWESGGLAPFMMMPETTMHEDDGASRGEDQVRSSRKIFDVEAVPVSQSMD